MVSRPDTGATTSVRRWITTASVCEATDIIVDDFTEHAMAFIEANRERPFFCYLPLQHAALADDGAGSITTRSSKAQMPEMRHRDPDTEDVMMTRAALGDV